MPFVAPLFEGIDRLHFYGVNIKQDFKGIFGLYKLSKKINREVDFDAVADLHDVLRTKLLRFFLGKKVAVIDKGRAEKKELTKPKNKKLHPLKTGFQRYAEVFEKLGYPIILNVQEGITKVQADTRLLPAVQKDTRWIGIAPFAKHPAKMYPLQKMKEVIEILLKNERINIIIFAAENEVASIRNWVDEKRVFTVAGKMNFAQEINLISQLKVMISMDSANMHLASLVGVPVVSIWGGTHPYLGFYGWGQHLSNAVQTDLPCRPSSVFGNKQCPVHGSAGCMQQITPQMIVDKVELLLGNNHAVC